MTLTGPTRRPSRTRGDARPARPHTGKGTGKAAGADGTGRATTGRATTGRAGSGATTGRSSGTGRTPASGRAGATTPRTVPAQRRATTAPATPAPPSARGRPAPRPTQHDGRARGFVILVLVVLSLFAARLVQMQGLDASTLAEEALGNRLVTTTLVADRGQITDADGVVLASNVERRDITVDQTLVAQYAGSEDGTGGTGIDGAAADIAAITGQDVAEVRFALTGDRKFAYVAKGVPPDTWREIQRLRVPGVYGVKTSARTYPAGAVAGNLLGFTGADGAGQAGIEGSLDDVLAGTDGSRNFERGRDGQMIPTGDMAEEPAVDGRNVRLTIDRDLQWFAQQSVTSQVATAKAEWGAVIAIEVETGNILALAESPSVDPNDPGASPAEDRGSRALSDVFEPGSTAKVVTAAAVLEEGLVTPTTQFEVPYRYTTSNGQTFRDSHEHGVEKRTFAGVLAESSNTGTVQAGQLLSKEQRYDYLTRFGIGQPSGLEFPGETRGILAQPDDWDGRQQFAVLFGQGVSTNALQATNVFATIANDGVRMSPRLVDGVAGEDGLFEEAPASQGTQVVSPETAAAVRTMLESAVDDGTGTLAAIPGYRVAGKTGTAQAPAPGGYSGYTGSFIGMAPADDPKIVVGVVIQRPTNGYYGGTVAGPVFKDVMSFALQDLGIPPTGTTPTPYPLTWE